MAYQMHMKSGRGGEIKSGYTHFAEGDVALAKITPCFENGKSTVFRGLTGAFGAGTTELHVVRPITVLAEYILIFLKSPHFINAGIPKMTGTAGQKRVPSEYFAHSPFPLPPLAEQQRIIARVDELMALCDQLEAAQVEREACKARVVAGALDRLTTSSGEEEVRHQTTFYVEHFQKFTSSVEDIEQLRGALLNLAIQGRLVCQEPADEPSAEVVNRIRHQGRGLVRKKKVGDSGPPPMPESPFQLPPGWSWATFPELGLFGRGKSKHRPRNDASLFLGGTHPLVQTGDVARSGGVIRSFTSKYNDKGLAQSHKWPQGTLCITIAANIADSGILSFDACFPDSVVGFVPASEFPNARYFEYFVRTAKARLLDFAPATAQKNINLEILSAVQIPLPPIAEMGRIVARLDQLMRLCDELEQSIDVTFTEKSRLLGAVLHASLKASNGVESV
ncbi:restriction endonuclease subunit S [Oscillatoria amoena NRMC-F 0135]|nr:restriction endonuclease subunit S [Oscillatoria amoena NRMC-F 0135]